MCFVVLCLCITCVCFLLAPVGAIQKIVWKLAKPTTEVLSECPAGGIQKIARTRNVKFRQFGVFSNALLGVGKLKSFLKNFVHHNNQMPPLNISQNVFTNYKRACFEYRKLLGCEL
jgi:hypothetical protein